MTIAPEIKHELLAAAHRPPAPARGRLVRFARVGRWPRRPAAMAIGLALLMAAGAGATISQLGPEPDQRQLRQAASRPSDATTGQKQLFSVLTRPRQADDELPASAVKTLNGAAGSVTHGENPDLARRLHHPDRAVWLTVGTGTFCFVAKPQDEEEGGTIGGCQPASTAAQYGLLGYQTGGARLAGKAVVTGIVPDGVSTVTLTLDDGNTQNLQVIDNVYAFITDRPVKLSFVDADGATHVLPSKVEPR
jgi:hypothetical protein